MQFPVGQLCEVPGQGTIKLLPTVLREGGINQPKNFVVIISGDFVFVMAVSGDFDFFVGMMSSDFDVFGTVTSLM
jgi:hypothetical protein